MQPIRDGILISLFYLLLCVILGGCGIEEGSHTAETPSDPAVIDPAFVDLYKQFEADTGHSPWSVSIGFGVSYSDSGDAAGSCYHSPSTNSDRILIDVKYWAMYDDTAKELLVYHELGHCVLKRRHVEDHDSIMRPILFDTIAGYEADRQALIDELIGK
jgi:hypothetical protein